MSSLSLAAPLHGVQAHALERQKAWAAAIHEYALTGESAPNAPNIARVYVEWGEQQLAQQVYGGAVIHFGIVISEYGRSGDSVTRAKQELYTTYTAWLQAGGANMPYADAISALMSHQTEPGCDAACQTATQAIEVQARFQFGTQLAAKGDYPDAITQFETIQTKFAKSEYAAQAHKAAAQAYFAHGQSQLTSACSQALTDYQTLVKRYADTAEGKQAHSALAAGVDVSGVLTSMPANPLPTLHLSKHIDVASFFLSSEYTTTPDASGNYTFHHVAPGNYNIASTHLNGSVVDYTLWQRVDDFYTVHVGQLCAVSIGQLDYNA
jgi:tetratricopeptide (TPR) repeat protein